MSAVVGALTVVSQALTPSSASATERAELADPGGDWDRQRSENMKKHNLTDLTGIHAEYATAIMRFPFPLPKDAAFPPRSRLVNTVPNELWERGIGAAEAYFFWEGVTIAAAEEAQGRGDESEKARLLELVESGYRSFARNAFLDNADGPISQALEQAQKGDFSALSGLSSYE